MCGVRCDQFLMHMSFLISRNKRLKHGTDTPPLSRSADVPYSIHDCVSTWSYEKFLNLNQAKCKFMLISRKRNSVLCLKPLQLNGVVLDSVQSFKYLGVMLTSDMSWSAHVSMVCSRARKILGVNNYIVSFMLTLQVQFCCSYIYLWSDHMLNMLPRFGHHI